MGTEVRMVIMFIASKLRHDKIEENIPVPNQESRQRRHHLGT